MKIPKKLIVGGRLIDIELSKDLIDKKNLLGQCIYNENKIILQTPCDGFTEEKMYETLWHELVHAMFNVAGHNELSNNEQIVDLLATFIRGIERQLHGTDSKEIKNRKNTRTKV